MNKGNTLILLTSVLLCISAQSCASSSAWVSGAMQLSKITGENNNYGDPLAGAQIGYIQSIADFNNQFGLRGEVNLSMQGAKYSKEGVGGRVKLLYANIPFVFRYQTKSGFFGEAGVQPGIALIAKNKYSGLSEDYISYLNRIDLGIPFGIGYEINNNLGIGVRVVQGITNISKIANETDRNLIAGIRVTCLLKSKK